MATDIGKLQVDINNLNENIRSLSAQSLNWQRTNDKLTNSLSLLNNAIQILHRPFNYLEREIDSLSSELISYNKTVLEGARNLETLGASLRQYISIIDDIGKSSHLSNAEVADLFNTFNVNLRGERNFALMRKFSKTLNDIGIDAQQTSKLIISLANAQNKFGDVMERIDRGETIGVAERFLLGPEDARNIDIITKQIQGKLESTKSPMAEYNKAIQDMKKSTENLALNVQQSLAPVVEKIAQIITAVTPAITAVSNVIGKVLGNNVVSTGLALMTLGLCAEKAFSKIINLINSFKDMPKILSTMSKSTDILKKSVYGDIEAEKQKIDIAGGHSKSLNDIKKSADVAAESEKKLSNVSLKADMSPAGRAARRAAAEKRLRTARGKTVVGKIKNILIFDISKTRVAKKISGGLRGFRYGRVGSMVGRIGRATTGKLKGLRNIAKIFGKSRLNTTIANLGRTITTSLSEGLKLGFLGILASIGVDELKEAIGDKSKTESGQNVAHKSLDVLSKAIAGGAIGASIGSIFPGPGTVIGGVAGALGGAAIGAYQNFAPDSWPGSKAYEERQELEKYIAKHDRGTAKTGEAPTSATGYMADYGLTGLEYGSAIGGVIGAILGGIGGAIGGPAGIAAGAGSGGLIGAGIGAIGGAVIGGTYGTATSLYKDYGPSYLPGTNAHEEKEKAKREEYANFQKTIGGHGASAYIAALRKKEEDQINSAKTIEEEQKATLSRLANEKDVHFQNLEKAQSLGLKDEMEKEQKIIDSITEDENRLKDIEAFRAEELMKINDVIQQQERLFGGAASALGKIVQMYSEFYLNSNYVDVALNEQLKNLQAQVSEKEKFEQRAYKGLEGSKVELENAKKELEMNEKSNASQEKLSELRQKVADAEKKVLQNNAMYDQAVVQTREQQFRIDQALLDLATKRYEIEIKIASQKLAQAEATKELASESMLGIGVSMAASKAAFEEAVNVAEKAKNENLSVQASIRDLKIKRDAAKTEEERKRISLQISAMEAKERETSTQAIKAETDVYKQMNELRRGYMGALEEIVTNIGEATLLPRQDYGVATLSPGNIAFGGKGVGRQQVAAVKTATSQIITTEPPQSTVGGNGMIASRQLFQLMGLDLQKISSNTMTNISQVLFDVIKNNKQWFSVSYANAQGSAFTAQRLGIMGAPGQSVFVNASPNGATVVGPYDTNNGAGSPKQVY